MTLWQVSELSGEDNHLFWLGGARFAPGERGGDVVLGGAAAFGKTTATGAEGRLSGRWKIIALLQGLEALNHEPEVLKKS